MTRIFKEDGQAVPVTLIEAGPCRVVQLKTVETDKYSAVQLGFGVKKESRVNKPELQRFKKLNIPAAQILREFRDYPLEAKIGDEITASIFSPGEKLDIIGVTKGKGFAGVMKRHGFSAHKASHGTHESFRGPGSIGMHTWPGRIWPGKRMAGRLGGSNFTARNLEIVRVEAEKNLIYVKGAIPGPNGGILEIRPTKKR